MTLADRLHAALHAGPDGASAMLAGDDPDHVSDDAADAPMRAAVLIAVTDRAEPGVILTERAASLRQHPGQIAFPGGRIDPTDADAAAAALREAHEELGIEPGRVRIVGAADPYRTITGFAVTPIVGVIPPDMAMTPSDGEVADWFEMPLAALLDPARHHRAQLEFDGRVRHIYEIMWNGRRIWGATAAMAVNLSRRLRWS